MLYFQLLREQFLKIDDVKKADHYRQKKFQHITADSVQFYPPCYAQSFCRSWWVASFQKVLKDEVPFARTQKRANVFWDWRLALNFDQSRGFGYG